MTLPFTYSYPCPSRPQDWTVSFEIDKKIWLFENNIRPYRTACFDTTTKTWEHQTVTRTREHFGRRNSCQRVRSAVLNGKGYVWGENQLMEFDPVTQIWRNTGHMFRDTNKYNYVSDITQIGNCLYTYIVELNPRSWYFLILNMQTGERTVRVVDNFSALDDIRLIVYNNTIYINSRQDIFVYEEHLMSIREVPTTGQNEIRGIDSICTVENLVYFKCTRREIRVLNMDTFEWTLIHSENPRRHFPFFIREIFVVDEVIYLLWHDYTQHGFVMIEPKPSLSTICLLTLANQFTENPEIREHLRPRWGMEPTDYQPYNELRQQIPWPLHPNFDNLIRWRKRYKICKKSRSATRENRLYALVDRDDHYSIDDS